MTFEFFLALARARESFFSFLVQGYAAIIAKCTLDVCVILLVDEK